MNKPNICILGAGRSGQAAARLAECLRLSARMLTDDDTVSPNDNFLDVDLIIVSPGIPPTSPLYREAVASRREIISELEFAARHFPGKYFAVTGTNGKTTTTELTVQLLLAAGVNAVAAGNIGNAFSAVCAGVLSGGLPPDTLPVVEVSSFQLERVRDFAPLAAAILNVADDHLDRYPGGLAEYGMIKERIFNHVPPANRIYGITYKPGWTESRAEIENGLVKLDGLEVIAVADLPLQGRHNQENVLAALELAVRGLDSTAAQIPAFRNALSAYSPARHRLEKVLENNGITYVNDSKGTNPAAVIAALRSIPGADRNIRLILGGLDKDMDFSPLNDYAARIRKAYLTGQCREKLYRTLHDRLDCEQFPDFDVCVRAACREAVTGDTVLLSPGCASWDMFKDYRERGDRFGELVRSHGFTDVFIPDHRKLQR
ncbi:MAG: UDP-N-acetylmuramoyl-L-alanine--D-glutamate ligase [Victivallaceae bacterium]|nr:UDP-N-acetylmuramoyl-L-alanine--D-glutamate ligase [Victivallaceae bacterium]